MIWTKIVGTQKVFELWIKKGPKIDPEWILNTQQNGPKIHPKYTYSTCEIHLQCILNIPKVRSKYIKNTSKIYIYVCIYQKCTQNALKVHSNILKIGNKLSFFY